MELDFSNIAGNLVSTAILIPIVTVLFKQVSGLTEKLFAMQREHTEALKNVVIENTRAMDKVSIVMEKCNVK